jgi:FMN-dependent NADH-azoreductase
MPSVYREGMKTLLVLNASGRVTHSITRRLTSRFIESWRIGNPQGTVVQRDVGHNPPPPVNECWIAAAFTAPEQRSAEMNEVLQTSETLIEEVEVADTVLLGTPIYNFGMPAQLKAWFDQIIRVGRTFEMVPGAADPYRPLLSSKPVIVVVSAGDGAMHPGGALFHLNHLEPHLQTLFGFVGLPNVTFVRVGDEEQGDDRLKQSLMAAEATLDMLAARGIATVQPPKDMRCPA